MSREAVQFVTRHGEPHPPEGASQVAWIEATVILYFIADMSDPSGHGCRASQTTIGARFGIRRQRVNELVALLLAAGALEKEPGARRYVVAGVAGHDPTRCGHPYCKKEALTVFRRNRQELERKKRNRTALTSAMADAAYMESWATEQEAR